MAMDYIDGSMGQKYNGSGYSARQSDAVGNPPSASPRHSAGIL